MCYLERRRPSDELGYSFRDPRGGALFSTSGVTLGIPEDSCAPVISTKSCARAVIKLAIKWPLGLL
jgi:hypothetical protein